MCRPSASQWAASLSSATCWLPSSRKLPTATSPSSMLSGSFSVGRLIGPLPALSPLGGRSSATRSAATRCRHRRSPARQAGDQRSSGRSTTSCVPSCAQDSRCACQAPPRRPSKPLTCRPGTRPSSQALPVWVPSSAASPRSSARSSPTMASKVIFSAFTVLAPWRSAGGNRRRRRAHGPGRGATGRPARPSARRSRPRS